MPVKANVSNILKEVKKERAKKARIKKTKETKEKKSKEKKVEEVKGELTELITSENYDRLSPE
jgi:Spy/CpxP family protein refolding chaperone